MDVLKETVLGKNVGQCKCGKGKDKDGLQVDLAPNNMMIDEAKE